MKRDTINYFVVGSFVLGMFVLLMIALFKVTGRDSSTVPYYVYYETIPGIIHGSTVTYGGFQVGRVNNIERSTQDGKMLYRLELAIRKDWKIPKDSRAAIVMPAMLSDRQIDIEAGESREFLAKGGTIITSYKVDFMQAMQEVATELNDLSENSIKPLINNIQGPLATVGESLDTNVPRIAKNLNILLDNLTNTTNQLNALMSPKNKAHLEKVFANADVITAGIAGMTNDFFRAADKSQRPAHRVAGVSLGQ